MNKWEAKKGSGETKGDTQKYTKNAFWEGNCFFWNEKQTKERKKIIKANKNQKTNKEGLCPSEVATKKQKTNKRNKKKQKKT